VKIPYRQKRRPTFRCRLPISVRYDVRSATLFIEASKRRHEGSALPTPRYVVIASPELRRTIPGRRHFFGGFEFFSDGRAAVCTMVARCGLYPVLMTRSGTSLGAVSAQPLFQGWT